MSHRCPKRYLIDRHWNCVYICLCLPISSLRKFVIVRYLNSDSVDSYFLAFSSANKAVALKIITWYGSLFSGTHFYFQFEVFVVCVLMSLDELWLSIITLPVLKPLGLCFLYPWGTLRQLLSCAAATGSSSILLLQVFPNKTRSLSPTFLQLQKCTKNAYRFDCKSR